MVRVLGVFKIDFGTAGGSGKMWDEYWVIWIARWSIKLEKEKYFAPKIADCWAIFPLVSGTPGRYCAV